MNSQFFPVVTTQMGISVIIRTYTKNQFGNIAQKFKNNLCLDSEIVETTFVDSRFSDIQKEMTLFLVVSKRNDQKRRLFSVVSARND